MKILVKVNEKSKELLIKDVIGIVDSKDKVKDLIKEKLSGNNFGYQELSNDHYMVHIHKNNTADREILFKLVDVDKMYIDEPSQPYYFKTKGLMNSSCIEPCQVKNDIMIGSAACQECEFNAGNAPVKSKFSGPDWIMCLRLSEATNNIEHDQA
jgi:hypothetical protein